MPLIEWNESLELGVRSVDRQHQRLVRYINLLDEAIKEGKQSEVLGSILEKLIEYTESHFSYEERLFDVHKYPGEKKHVKLHTELIEKVHNFQENFKNSKDDISLELMDFLKSWLVDHILIEDKKYAPYLIANGAR